MKPPPFLGVFKVWFPGWGGDDEPRYHESNGKRELCDMPFHPPHGGFCMSARFGPEGVAGVDRDGQVWALVEDRAIEGKLRQNRLRWVKFPVEVAE